MIDSSDHALCGKVHVSLLGSFPHGFWGEVLEFGTSHLDREDPALAHENDAPGSRRVVAVHTALDLEVMALRWGRELKGLVQWSVRSVGGLL